MTHQHVPKGNPIKGLIGATLCFFIGFAARVVVAFYPGLEVIHYPVLLILGFLAGCGIATFSVGICQTSYWYPQAQQDKALGFYAGVGNTAPGIFSLLMATKKSIIAIEQGVDGC